VIQKYESLVLKDPSILDCSNMKISTIKPDFSYLNNLIEINLSSNLLTNIDANIFASFNNLKILKLNSNKIKKIENFANFFIPTLEALYCHNNDIIVIDGINSNLYNGNLKLFTIYNTPLAVLNGLKETLNKFFKNSVQIYISPPPTRTRNMNMNNMNTIKNYLQNNTCNCLKK